MSNATEMWLYRCWDANDVLLYVGISTGVFGRMAGHQRDSSWANQLVKITVERLPSLEAAREAERIAIKTELPRFNKTHGDRLVRLKESLIRERESLDLPPEDGRLHKLDREIATIDAAIQAAKAQKLQSAG